MTTRVLRSSTAASLPDTDSTSGSTAPMVTPFARALSVLAAYTPQDRWLCNGELARRTGLPASTVTRMTRTLLKLGYLRFAPDTRKFRLGASALALGYRATIDTEIQHQADEQLHTFAEEHEVHIHLSARERLDLIVIDSYRTSALPVALQPGVGTRMGLVSSPAGWALLASLPDAERDYLMQSAANTTRPEWRHLRRQSSEAIGQVLEGGFCVAFGQSGQPMTVVAAPVQVPGEAPLAVSCMRPSKLMGRRESMRELGPALVRVAQEIRSTLAHR